MSRESYVSYETARLLKEKGFDWECRAYWHEDDRELIESQSPCYLRNITNPCWFGNTAPTQQMACRWLREEHGLFIEIMCGEDGGNVWYDYDILPVGKDAPIIPESDGLITYNEPEEVIEAALQYVLTKLI